MASVPNLPIAPAIPVPGAPGASAEGAPLDIFAQLLSGGPAIAVVTAPGAAVPDAATLRAAPAHGEAEGAGAETASGDAPADIIPLLQAQSGFPVAVAPPAQGIAAPAEAAPVAATPEGKPVRTTPPAVPTPSAAHIVEPESDPAPVDALVDAAVKAAVEKIAGKPTARTGRAGRAAPTDGNAIETTAPVEQPRRAEAAAARIEAVVQAAAPAASAAPTAAIAPAFSAAPLAAQPAAVAAPTPNAVPDVAELVIERQLDLAGDDQWLDRLARDIARAGAGDEPLRFRLHPQTLGHLQVELSQSDRGANIRLTVETEAARNILLDAQPRLTAEARAQGVRLAGTEVDLGTASQQGGDARRNGEAQPQDVVRVVRATQSASPSSEPAAGRSDRYA
jgi:flagellar hook-length control protein FliK